MSIEPDLLDELDAADNCIHGRPFDEEAECSHCADLSQLRQRLSVAHQKLARVRDLEADVGRLSTALERAERYSDQQFHRASMLAAQLLIARADLDAGRSIEGDGNT